MALALVAFVLGNPVRNLIAGMQLVESLGVSHESSGVEPLASMEQLANGAALGFSHPWLGVGHEKVMPRRACLNCRGLYWSPNVGYPYNLIIHLFAEFGFSGLLWTFRDVDVVSRGQNSVTAICCMAEWVFR